MQRVGKGRFLLLQLLPSQLERWVEGNVQRREQISIRIRNKGIKSGDFAEKKLSGATKEAEQVGERDRESGNQRGSKYVEKADQNI